MTSETSPLYPQNPSDPPMRLGAKLMQEKLRAFYRDENHFYKVPEGLLRPKYFFYGTLTSPTTLQEVLGLDEPPALTDAVVRGYFLKRWGPYLALIPDPVRNKALEVHGKVYTVTQQEHKDRLADYEGSNYKLMPCRTEHGDDVFLTFAFVWDGPQEELDDLDERH